MSSIFLSHNHADKPFARRLASDLRAAGHVVWIDEAEIDIGDSLVEKIREGIDEVDYVAAILSGASIQSQWVKRELDIASNREIEEGKVVVLPLLLEEVALPGFLKGKLYGDFRKEENYHESLSLLLRKLGPVCCTPQFDQTEISRLRKELEQAKRNVAQHVQIVEQHQKAALRNKSPELRAAIEKANRDHPEHAPINVSYAFIVGNQPITLDYLLWCVAKAERRGGHPIEILFSIENKWPEASSMLEAYSEMLDAVAGREGQVLTCAFEVGRSSLRRRASRPRAVRPGWPGEQRVSPPV